MNNRPTLILLTIITAFQMGCQSQSAPTSYALPTLDPTLDVAPTSIRLPILATTATPQPTSSPLATPSTFQIVNPTIVALCPAKNQINPDQLGIAPSERLIILRSNDRSHSYWVLTPTDKTTATQIPDSANTRYVGVSPDHKWVALYTAPGIGPEETLMHEATVWAQSIDNRTKLGPFPNLEVPRKIEWISNELIALYDSGEPLAVVNPFSKEIKLLETLQANTTEYQEYLGPDGRAVIYSALRDDITYGWYYYDYIAPPVEAFKWLKLDRSDSDLFSIHASIRWFLDKVSIIVSRPYGMDIRNKMSIEDATSNSGTYLKVNVPGNDLVTAIKAWANNGDWIGLTRFDPNSGKAGSQFYRFDMLHQILYSYCLAYEPLTRMYISADGRFAAWTDFSDSTSHAKITSLVLNLETGQYSLLDDIEILGWGIIN